MNELFQIDEFRTIPSWMEPEFPNNIEEDVEKMKGVEGFPLFSDKKILSTSLPPYYFCAPNPYLSKFLKSQKLISDDLTPRGPLAVDIIAGKNDPLYFAHYYSTKVPPNGIVPFILHYTKPGEVVFDGFCGTGMTGVAAQLCADPKLNYSYGETGLRKAVISDLSPAATFIAAGTNAIGEISQYLDEIEKIIDRVEKKHANILRTRHVGWPRKFNKVRSNTEQPQVGGPGKIEYVVWSDVFTCSSCSHELSYWELVFKGPGKEISNKAPCPYCGSIESLGTLQRVWVSSYDNELQKIVNQAKQIPVLINYSIGKKRFEKNPDEKDIQTLSLLSEQFLENPAPCHPMPEGINTSQPAKSHGFTHVHHFFTRRNLILLNELWHLFKNETNPLLRMAGLYTLTGSIQRVCRLNRYMPNHDRHVGPLSGTLYVAPITAEIPAVNYLRSRIKDLRSCHKGPTGKDVLISTQSATDLSNIPENSIDYIFTDPPFGGNLNYSELNSLIEMWLDIRTNIQSEAVINETQNKDLFNYQFLMSKAFKEFYRILKPQKWMTVEFHNSQNSVWVAIQEALLKAGFVVADVRTLDKKKGTTKQLSYGAAVKQDLIISCYKPSISLEEEFKLKKGSQEAVWDFIRDHLAKLPVFISKNEQSTIISERKSYLLYDRMVAFHVQRGVAVPFSATEFYSEITQRFPERDGMFFLPNQAAEYDKKRLTVKGVEQLSLFVSDEASARQWLDEIIRQKPQTFQEIHPQFIKETNGWSKTEKRLELLTLLEQNFILYDGKSPVPEQIHSYLSTNWKDMRNLSKQDPGLIAKAKDRWYVPDPNKAEDLEKLREKSLLKEFEDYLKQNKKLKVFRLEAVRTGFKKAWKDRNYDIIVSLAEKLPNHVLEEDPKLLMWYDQAMARMQD